MASAALLAAGCSTENKAEGTEYGTLKVSCTADGSIDAASDDTSRMPAAPSVPQAGDFTLTVTFSEQTLEATSPRTCHIFTFDAKDAGSVTLTVTLSDDYTETRQIDCEVNEGAIDDTK